MKQILTGLAVAASMIWATEATSAVNYIKNGSGKLVRVTGVMVNGNEYAVDFVDSTCVSAFDGCDAVSDFAFQSLSTALDAVQALRDQVMLDVTEGMFDTDPELTAGCLDLSQCEIFVPYGFQASSVVARALRNSDGSIPDGIFTTPKGVNDDFAFDTDGVWAVFGLAPVPVPAGALLILSALAGLGVTARVGTRQT